MRRALTALSCAAILAWLVPGAVSADGLTRYHDHTVEMYCEGPVVGGYAYASFFSSERDAAASAEVGIWMDPAIPFEDPADVSGVVEAFTATGDDPLVLSADIPVAGPGGEDLGTGTLSAELTPNGPASLFSEPSFGNHKSRTTGTTQEFSGAATFTLGAMSATIDGCSGIVSDIDAWATNPRSFVSSDSGLDLFCHWDTADGFAELFVQAHETDTFASAYIESADGSQSSSSFSGTASTAGLDLDFVLVDPVTNEPNGKTAAATATFTPVGPVVTSTLRQASVQEKLDQQALHAQGVFSFETGASFAIDDVACRSISFSRHAASSSPTGPKATSRAPANDAPAGAIALRPGDKLVTSNVGAAVDPEVPIVTCPEGPFDDFGRTLWYAIDGTGGPITVDTAGSLIDTVAAAYAVNGDDLIEVACNDDTEPMPLQISYQAAITFDSVAGATYLVEVGGYRRLFDPENVETGQIRVAVR